MPEVIHGALLILSDPKLSLQNAPSALPTVEVSSNKVALWELGGCSRGNLPRRGLPKSVKPASVHQTRLSVSAEQVRLTDLPPNKFFGWWHYANRMLPSEPQSSPLFSGRRRTELDRRGGGGAEWRFLLRGPGGRGGQSLWLLVESGPSDSAERETGRQKISVLLLYQQLP